MGVPVDGVAKFRAHHLSRFTYLKKSGIISRVIFLATGPGVFARFVRAPRLVIFSTRSRRSPQFHDRERIYVEDRGKIRSRSWNSASRRPDQRSVGFRPASSR